MKRIIAFLIFSIFFYTSYSQSKLLGTISRQWVDSIVNDVLYNTKNTYNQVKIDSIAYPTSIKFHYSDGEHQLYIYFGKHLTGGNPDLDKPDTLSYSFVGIRGFYQDVFPFWKKEFDKSADYVLTATNKHGVPKLIEFAEYKYIARFNKQEDIWELEVLNHGLIKK